MRINSITIKDFRSFKNINYFDFNIDSKKNIILIGGENGSGKTSIFEAIKLCLYGPLTYKYKGIVSKYISKIKSLINEDAFLKKDIESFIELNISLLIDGIEKDFNIRRSWKFSESNALIEEFSVYKENMKLTDSEVSEFNIYLNGILPPDIFDIFFFDGEKLHGLFENNKFNKELKDTILTLNNLDVISFMNNELMLNIRRKDKANRDIADYIYELENLEYELKIKRSEYDKNYNEFNENLLSIEQLQINIESMNKNFLESGGLTEAEKQEILKRQIIEEKNRDQINEDIKKFINEKLPYIMLKDKLTNIKNRLDMEEEYFIYKEINQKLDLKNLKEDLSIKNIEVQRDQLEGIVKVIESKLLSKNINDDFAPIHYLSQGQKMKFDNLLNEINNIDINKIDYFNKILEINNRLKEYRKILNKNIDEIEYEEYLANINKKVNLINELKLVNKNIQLKNDDLIFSISKIEKKIDKIHEKINLYKRDQNIEMISMEIIKLNKKLLNKVITKKRNEIEKSFKDIFDKIMRKQRFIDYIHLDDDFNITLYVRKKYSSKELYYIFKKFNFKEVSLLYGTKFLDEVIIQVGNDTRNELLKKLEYLNTEFKVSTKVDENKMSSGEKQIYILCLYWAIIKTSELSVPFIIDTPYARIDQNHRDAITNKYFPEISKQVIILSTNTEIEEDAYLSLDRYISKEYLLEYNLKDRSTKINNGYFYERRQ